VSEDAPAPKTDEDDEPAFWELTPPKMVTLSEDNLLEMLNNAYWASACYSDTERLVHESKVNDILRRIKVDLDWTYLPE
jgi:hypothetical protein